MRSTSQPELDWYAKPGRLTDISAYSEWLRALPEDLASLCVVIQGLLVHGHLGPLYGIEHSEQRLRTETNYRCAALRLATLLEADDRPLGETRTPENRQLGTCRDFALLLCAILRWQGRPARARCGFGHYFVPDRYEDHWVCEVWDEPGQRWHFVDAQIDDVQRKVFGPRDALDVGRDEFVTGSDAWARCRAGALDAGQFGLSVIHESGLWFVCGDFVRDVAALNKIELLPWDSWGVMLHPSFGEHPIELSAAELASSLPAGDLAELDRVAQLAAGSADVPALRSVYEDERWHAPDALLATRRPD